jgi:hypothetical protein
LHCIKSPNQQSLITSLKVTISPFSITMPKASTRQ